MSNKEAKTYAQKSVEVGQKALEIFTTLGEGRGIAAAQQNLAEAHLLLGNLTQAEESALAVVGLEDVTSLADGWRVLGLIKAAQGQFDVAHTPLTDAINYAQHHTNRYIEAWTWRDLMTVYLRQNKCPEAQQAATQAKTLFEGQGLTPEIEKISKMWHHWSHSPTTARI